jgi:hypothetical protein
MSLALPPLLKRSGFTGPAEVAFEAFEAACHAVYRRDFRGAPPECRPQPRHPQDSRAVTVRTTPHPCHAGRDYTYWHMITGDEGHPGMKRDPPDPERMERMPHVRPFIELCPEAEFKVWRNVRGQSRHLCIWHDKLNLLVILADYGPVWELKTCYRPQPRRRQELHKEYARSRKGWP